MGNPHNRHTKLVIRFFLSYSFILVIPFLLVIFTYHEAASVITQQANSKVRDNLIQARDVTDADLWALQTISMALQKDENVLSFYQQWTQQKDIVFAAYRASHNLPQYHLVNSLVEQIILFFGDERNSHCFTITNGNAMEYRNSLLSLPFGETKMNYQEMNDYLFEYSFYNDFIIFPSIGTTNPEAYFISDLISYHTSGYTATLMIQLSDSLLTDMLSSAMLNGQGAAFIATDENEMISYVNASPSLISQELVEQLLSSARDTNSESFLFQDMQVNLVRSSFNGWTYYSLIPNTVVLQELHSTRNLVLWVTGITFILGIGICLLLTMRNSRPLQGIIQMLNSFFRDTDEFDDISDFNYIDSAISQLIQRNCALSAQEHFRSSLYNLAVLGKLFVDNDIDTDRFRHELQQSSILLDNKVLLVIYLHIHGWAREALPSPVLEDSLLSNLLQELEHTCQGTIYAYPIDKTNYVFLAACSDSWEDEALASFMKEQLNQLGKTYFQNTTHHLDFFISDPFREYQNVSQGYASCKKLVLNVVKNKDLFAFSSKDLPSSPPLYHYSLNQEIRLTQLICYGSAAKLQELLEELRYQNFVMNTLSESMKTYLYSAIYNSLQRNLSEYCHNGEIHQLITSMIQKDSFDEIEKSILQLQTAIQSLLHRNLSAPHTEEINVQILNYIHQHYGNSNLNLSLLCEELSIPESAASRFFQDIDSSFHSYLESTRIDAACSLLLKNDMTIKLVAETVGYTSDTSFRRAFKRILGISPSAFIKSIT